MTIVHIQMDFFLFRHGKLKTIFFHPDVLEVNFNIALHYFYTSTSTSHLPIEVPFEVPMIPYITQQI